MTRMVVAYNADTGAFSAIAGALHRFFSPSTYSCRLCALTHGTFSAHGEWRRFIESLDYPVEFLHRDQRERLEGLSDVELPAVLIQRDDETPKVLMSAREIAGVGTVETLVESIKGALSRLQTA